MAKERPILFSGEMVRALLEGRKAQTRRIMRGQPHEECGGVEVGWYEPAIAGRDGDEEPGPAIFGAFSLDGEWGLKCPYGAPGDRLWVRETLTVLPGVEAVYAADNAKVRNGERFTDSSRTGIPSIHMPRWASRITPEVTEVRGQRVRGTPGADAFAEGVRIRVSEPGRPLLRLSSRVPFAAVSPKHPREWGADEFARFEFLHLFHDINRRAPVTENPWVWAITFKRLEAGA